MKEGNRENLVTVTIQSDGSGGLNGELRVRPGFRFVIQKTDHSFELLNGQSNLVISGLEQDPTVTVTNNSGSHKVHVVAHLRSGHTRTAVTLIDDPYRQDHVKKDEFPSLFILFAAPSNDVRSIHSLNAVVIGGQVVEPVRDDSPPGGDRFVMYANKKFCMRNPDANDCHQTSPPPPPIGTHVGLDFGLGMRQVGEPQAGVGKMSVRPLGADFSLITEAGYATLLKDQTYLLSVEAIGSPMPRARLQLSQGATLSDVIDQHGAAVPQILSRATTGYTTVNVTPFTKHVTGKLVLHALLCDGQLGETVFGGPAVNGCLFEFVQQ